MYSAGAVKYDGHYLLLLTVEDLQGKTSVPEGFLKEFVENRTGLKDVLEEGIKKRIVRHLETIFGTRQDDGHSLITKFKPWYPERKISDEYTVEFEVQDPAAGGRVELLGIM